MRHQLGLMSGTRYACLLVEGGLPPPNFVVEIRFTHRGSTYFPFGALVSSAAGERSPARAASRITPTTSCNERHALSSYGIDFTHTVTSRRHAFSGASVRCSRFNAHAFARAIGPARPETLNADTEGRAARRYARTLPSEQLASFVRTRQQACSWGMQGGTPTQLYATHPYATLAYATLWNAYATQRHSIRN